MGTLVTYLPATISAGIIIAFEVIYFWIALKQVGLENHKYVSQYENSLILKVFSFYFVNANCSNFIYAFYTKSLKLLAQNLAIILVLKQVAINLFEFFLAKLTTGRNLKKMDERF
mmetsp:Transcript_29737/g.21500  ORF Transcript_29737/g.21500 Transcript_29737/m.21500 type:complete len:115 (+) Transcript_29737:2177-2521(+)